MIAYRKTDKSFLIFLKSQSLTELVPLANLLQSKIFKFGEVIIREGDIPQGAFIVAKGALRVLKLLILFYIYWCETYKK